MAGKAFLKSLPQDELAPVEHALRKAVIKALKSTNGRPFPLIEWIDLRIGGEIETLRTPEGLFELRFRDDQGPQMEATHDYSTPPADLGSPEAFFQSLALDTFDAPEENLREAVFEFLATWTSPELANLAQMQQFPAVQRMARAFLPKNVRLKDWIEHRIGGEIEFRQGPRGGAEVVHLTESARGAVMEKYQQMSAAAQIGRPPMGQQKRGPPPGPPHGPPPGPPQGAAPGAPGVDKEAWFSGLPTDELLPEESALREALLNWMQTYPGNRKSGVIHLSDAGGDGEIKRAKQEVLPKTIKLADWIERRIGGELELRPVANGQQEVHLRGQAPPNRKGGGAGGRGRGDPTKAKDPAVEEAKELFFASLPEDEFSEAEDNMRAALLDFLEQWTQPGFPSLAEAGASEEVKAARLEVIPKGSPVNIKDWIDRRCGGEIETRASGPGGCWIFGLRGTLGPKKRRTD